MTHEEAIKHFKSLQKRYTKEHNGRMCEKVNLALEALDKQIPKKPYDTVRCPLCKIEVELQPIDIEQVTYCLHCGQAIDWEENE